MISQVIIFYYLTWVGKKLVLNMDSTLLLNDKWLFLIITPQIHIKQVQYGNVNLTTTVVKTWNIKKVQVTSKGEISGLGTEHLYILDIPTSHLYSPFDLG